jgi:hypothetical protein
MAFKTYSWIKALKSSKKLLTEIKDWSITHDDENNEKLHT